MDFKFNTWKICNTAHAVFILQGCLLYFILHLDVLFIEKDKYSHICVALFTGSE